MPENIKIAVLMTCYNRRKTTLKCLTALYAQENLKDVCLDVYLVDDGSADGTGDAVRGKFPKVNVIQGDGTLFWNGGMRVAWQEAMKSEYDFFLWLNDDSTLYPTALQSMLDTASYLRKRKLWPSIVVGSMQDPTTGKFTYGGKKRRNKWLLLPMSPVVPTEKPRRCDTVNGNCVLIPQDLPPAIGILDELFTHGIGDYDYALRAQKIGINSWSSPGYVGICSKNSQKNTIYDANISIKERTQMASRATGIPPASEMMVFIKRHGGLFWPLYWLRYLFRSYFPQLWVIARGKSVDSE